ncbi:MAG: NAD(+) synthase [Ktedonobacterales bacterium]
MNTDAQTETDFLRLDPATEVGRIAESLRRYVRQTFRRRGVVVGVSGGVDSATTLAICVRAFGAERVLAVLMPDKDSSPDSSRLGREVAEHYGVRWLEENLTAALAAMGCYAKRDGAIQRVVKDFDPARDAAKIVLPQDLLDHDALNVFSVVVVRPDGSETRARLPLAEYREVVAASNMKQRTRMLTLYYHAEARDYAVIGTANKNEHAQGFFVKYGDSGVDIQAIAHLYKTQVYQLAEYLDVPTEIRSRPPTTDTYSAASTQEEFFFRLPFKLMDVLYDAHERGLSAADAGRAFGLEETQVARAYRDFESKSRTTEYLRMPPVLLEPAERDTH